MGFGGNEEVIYSASVLEALLGVLVVGVGSVGARVGGVESCFVAGLLVVRVGGLHGASVSGVQGGIPVSTSQDRAS